MPTLPTNKIEKYLMLGLYSGSQESEVCPMPYALCPMPYALCPMPYARRVPHVTEKGYTSESNF